MRSAPPLARQRGLTMIELLVAVFLLTTTLVSLAGLQITSLQTSQSANYRAQASMLSSNIVERMQANREAARAGKYDYNSEQPMPTGSSRDQQDLKSWLEIISSSLPEGTGSIVSEEHNDAEHSGLMLFTIRIQWNDSRGDIHSTSADIPSSNHHAFEYRAML